MLLDAPQARLTLAHNQMARLTSACGARVECVAGTAWITIDGDPRDVILLQGKSFVVESAAPVIVHAIQGAADVKVHAKAVTGRHQPPTMRGAIHRREWFWSGSSPAAA